MLEIVQTIWDFAVQAGPFAAVLSLGVAYLSEKNRRSAIRAIVANHAKELEKRDARIDALGEDFKSLLSQTTGIDLTDGGQAG